ncbi:MAG: menaquinone-specific isochorismate synthase [Thermoleophilaceae bacterium]|nr:menaquinone-specific isochorismate synthase [Thermoleophilaceae bacterium]
MSLTTTEGVLDRLRGRLQRAPLASVTVPLPVEMDVSAAVLAARRPGDRYFCFEQPDRDGFALAGLGAVAVVEGRGSNRFASVAAQCREIAHGLECDEPGPAWVGGFAFSPDGGLTPEWSGLAPGQLVLPEVLLRRERGQAWMVVTARSVDEAEQRLSELRPASMPLFDPDLVQTARVASAAPPEHFESAIERAVERIAAGDLHKVVLAREVRVHAPREIEIGAVFDGLRVGFPSCYCYLVGTPELAFVGASPELLARRDGQRVQTVALAGTRRRSADPAVDSHLGEQLLQSPKDREEQAIVTRRIKRTLEPVSVWVTAADEPVLVKVLNVQHLGTPIRAQLAEPLSVVEVAGRLHPTPAVGGEPAAKALPLIPALEGLDRGWYAGPVGWTDLYEDGEFCVALRCALLRGRVAHLYAGEGIVRDSVPSEELAANEAKLQALLPLLT